MIPQNHRPLHQNHTLRLIAAFLVFWIPAIIFAKIAGEIAEREPIGLDATILGTIHSWSSPMLDTFFKIATTFADVRLILPASLLILGFLLYRKRRRNALVFLFAVGGAAFANFTLKLLFHRNRPSLWHPSIVETGYSFPSGHAMLSSALALTVVLLLWNTKWRIPSIIAGALFVLIIGLSRLYLGVHYPSDVFAGWLVSFLWVLIVFVITRELSRIYCIHRATREE